MEGTEQFDPNGINDIEKDITDMRDYDSGYCKIIRKKLNKRGILKNTAIKVYVTGGVGCKIRDAESGYYYNDFVGTKNETKYFKVSFSTGELNSKNDMNTLFYISPRSYENHMGTNLDEEIITRWNNRELPKS
jgi:hypothetical protein